MVPYAPLPFSSSDLNRTKWSYRCLPVQHYPTDMGAVRSTIGMWSLSAFPLHRRGCAGCVHHRRPACQALQEQVAGDPRALVSAALPPQCVLRCAGKSGPESARLRSNQFLDHAALWCCAVVPDFVPATLLCGAVVLCCSARLRSNQFLNHAAVWCCVVVPDFVPVTLLCGAVALWCCSARLCFQPRWCVVWCCVVVCGVLLRGTMQADHWVGINQPDKMFPFARAIFDAQGTIQVSPCGGRLTIQLACVLACVLACERCTPPPRLLCVVFHCTRGHYGHDNVLRWCCVAHRLLLRRCHHHHESERGVCVACVGVGVGVGVGGVGVLGWRRCWHWRWRWYFTY